MSEEKPDAIINIVDATNLSRSLFFTTQLLELGIPVVVALNKSDINTKKETVIDVQIPIPKAGMPGNRNRLHLRQRSTRGGQRRRLPHRENTSRLPMFRGKLT